MISPVVYIPSAETQYVSLNLGPAQLDASRDEISSFNSALSQILDIPNAGELLKGVDSMLGDASNVAITGSVALALHLANLGCELVRRPANLDLLVNQTTMKNFRNVDADALYSKGFMRSAAAPDQLEWSNGHHKVRINAIESNVSPAGRGLGTSRYLHGLRVVPLSTLISNLESRALSELHNNQVKSDIAAVYTTLLNQRN